MFLVNWTAVFRAKVDENLQQLVLQVVIYDDDRASKIVVIWFCSGRDPTKKKRGTSLQKKKQSSQSLPCAFLLFLKNIRGGGMWNLILFFQKVGCDEDSK